MTRRSIKNRDKNIDLLKAICLICMILGHCGFPGTRFIYLFHMPLFFMASGYLFNKKRVTTFDGLRTFIFKKMKSLWVPYVVWNMTILALQNVFMKINFYTDNPEILVFSGCVTQQYITINEYMMRFIKILFLKSGTLFTGAFWFIRILFVIEIAVAVISWLLQITKVRDSIANIIMTLLAGFTLCIGYVLKIEDVELMGFAQCFVGFTLFWLGNLMRGDLVAKILEKKAAILAALVILLILNKQGIILLNQNEFTNPAFLLCSSIGGWIFVYGISRTIINVVHNVEVWAYKINKAAVDIMALHFIAFKLIASIQVYLWKVPIFYLARFPVLNGDSGWWILYCFVGIMVPFAFYTLRMELHKRLLFFTVKDNE